MILKKLTMISVILVLFFLVSNALNIKGGQEKNVKSDLSSLSSPLSHPYPYPFSPTTSSTNGGVSWLTPSCYQAESSYTLFASEECLLVSKTFSHYILQPNRALHTGIRVLQGSVNPYEPIVLTLSFASLTSDYTEEVVKSTPRVFIFLEESIKDDFFDFSKNHSIFQVITLADKAGTLAVRPLRSPNSINKRYQSVQIQIPAPGNYRVFIVNNENDESIIMSAEISPIVANSVSLLPLISQQQQQQQQQQQKTIQYLQPGVEVQGTIPFQGIVYFGLNVTIPFIYVGISVTNLYGDPDLFVTVDGSFPSTSNYQYKSVNWLTPDVIMVRQSDSIAGKTFCNPTTRIGQTCTLLAAVVNANLFNTIANFSISMTPFGVISPLINGISRYGEVNGTDINYYSFVAPIAQSTITFATQPFAGDPDLFVSSSIKGSQKPDPKDPTSYCWASQTEGRDVVEIFPGDITGCYCGATPLTCIYYVSVVAYPPAKAVYTIVASEDTNTVYTLLDGVPQVGLVPQGSSDQFSYTVPVTSITSNGPRSISISLTPFAGDTDLYVTLDNSPPSPFNYAYKSNEESGVDVVILRSTDAKIQASLCADASKPCILRISVFGFSPGLSWYQISATAGKLLRLADGVEVDDSVNAGAFTYFSFTVYDTSTAITISVSPSSGDPDVYVINNATDSTPLPTDKAGSWIWSGQGSGIEIVYIEPTDPAVISCPLPCTYIIGVQAWGRQNASFIIVAKTRVGRSVALSPLLPVVGFVGTGEYDRYTASFDRSVGMLEIVVTPISGDADLYIALDGRFVTRSNWSYASVQEAGVTEDIVITSSDLAFNQSITCGGRAPSSGYRLPCTASIAVYGFSTSAYIITAFSSVRALLDGVAVQANTKPGQYQYFIYAQLNRFVPLVFSVTPNTGDPDCFISTTNSRPNSTNYIWSGQSLGTEIIYILPTDPNIANCATPCIFYISVLAYGSQSASYSIQAQSSSTTALIPGQPVSGFAPPGLVFSYFVFRAPLRSAGGIEFVLTPTSGYPDTQIFVGNDIDVTTGRTLFPTLVCSDPSCGSYSVSNADWSSGQSLANNELQISQYDPNYRAGLSYIVGVISEGGASFQILGAVGNTIKLLTPSVPETGAVSAGLYSYYKLSSSSYGQGMKITLTPMSGDPDIFVSANSSNPRPDSKNFDKQGTGTSIETVLFQWSELIECQSALQPPGSPSIGICSLFVAVYGWTNASYSIVGEIVDSNATSLIELVDGQPQAGLVAAGQWTYFYTNINLPNTQTYSIYVRAISGDADLYVTTDGSTPSLTNFQYSSSKSSGDDFVDVAPGTNGYNSTTTMFAGVFAYGSLPATFDITYSSASAVVAIAPGIAQSGLLAAGQYAYFSFAAPSQQLSTTWTVTALTGDPDIYISQWPPLQRRLRPTVTSYTWKGENDGSDTVAILPYPLDTRACRSSCTYIAGVFCSNPQGFCRFTVSASQGSELTQLLDGQPASGSVAQNSLVYFRFSLPASGRRSVTIRATPLTGSAQVYVTVAYDPLCRGSTCSPLPTPQVTSSYNWASSVDGGRSGSGTVFIAYNDPALSANITARGVFFTIGVIGYSQPINRFSILASTIESVITLNPGVPSTGNRVLAGVNSHFQVSVGDLTQDLALIATVSSGSVVITVSPPFRTPTIYGFPSCTAPRVCNATWTSVVAAQAGNAVRIFAQQGDGTKIGPCLGPYVYNSGPWGRCNTIRDWTIGTYNIGVFGVVDSAYMITAYTSASYQSLEAGVPQSGQSVPGSPAVYKLAIVRPTTAISDVRFIVQSDASPLSFFIRSCVSFSCSPSDQTPGPGNFEDTGSVSGGGTTDFFITRLSPAMCNAAVGGICFYFISLYNSAQSGCIDPTDPTCLVTFTVTGSSQDGSTAPTVINYAGSLENKVYGLNGNTQAGGNAVIEVLFNSSFSSQAMTADISISVDSCGPGLQNVYVCRLNPPAGIQGCTNAFLPTSGTGTGGNTLSGSTSSGSIVGRARLLDTGVAGQSYFIAIAADGTNPSGQSGVWAYDAKLSAGKSALYLLEGPYSTMVTADDTGISANVSWTMARLGLGQNPAISKPASLATYQVYAAMGGFGSNTFGIVSTTVCGLFRASSLLNIDAVSTSRGATSITVTGLQPNTFYEFAVVATCDRTCLSSFGDIYEENDNVLKETSSTSSTPPDGYGPPGYVTQSVAYLVTSATTGGSNGPPSAISRDLGPAGIAGVVGGSFALIVLAVSIYCYTSGKRADFSGQYASLDVTDAMATISTPVEGNTARSGNIQDWGPSSRNTGNSFLNPLRNILTGSGGGGGGGGGGGYRRPGLAESEGVGYVEDRAAGYL
jgi:hypothetical protein